MLKSLKNNANKLVAFLLVFVMVFGVVPAQTLVSVFAAEPEVEKQEEPVAPKYEVTPYSGKYDKEAHPAVKVTGTEEDDIVTYSVDGKEFTEEVPEMTVPGQKSIVVKVTNGGTELFVSDPVIAKVSNGVITGIVVTPYANKAYDEEEHYAVTVEGTQDKDKVEYQVNDGAYSEEKPVIKTPGSQTIKVRVTREYYDVFESEAVVASVVKAEIDGITVDVYTEKYDGESHDAVTVKGYKAEDTVFYSTDGVTYAEEVPQIETVGKKAVYVKVQRGDGTNYNDYITFPVSFEAEVTPADITGVTAKGYKGIYKVGEEFEAIVEVAGTLKDDVVTYSTTKKSGYSEDIPKVSEVKDSGTYYVKIQRENYADLILEVKVEIEKAPQTIEFKNPPKYVYYNEDNSFVNLASKNNEDSKGTITYAAKKAVNGISVVSDGTVTYEKVGTITVVATVAECDNYLSASAEYEIEIKYIAAPPIQMNKAGYLNFYKGDVEIYASGWSISDQSNALGNDTWKKDKITVTEEGKYEGKQVAFKDSDDNITDFQTIDTFYIDKTAPTFEVEFEKTNSGAVAKVINYLTFGICCKESVTVTVNGNDGENGSGVKKIQLFTYDNEDGDNEQEVESTSNAFELSPKFEGILKVQITDNLGNSTGKVWVNGTNSNYKEGDKNAPVKLILEKVDPVIETVENGADQYSEDVVFKFKVSDADSGIAKVDVFVNDNRYEGFPVTYINVLEKEEEFSVDTCGLFNKEGECNIKIIVTDNAGNDIEDDSTCIKVDKTAPVITDFISYKDAECKEEIKNEEIGDYALETSYGYYFNQKMYVKIQAEDVQTANEFISEVSKIGYKLVSQGTKFEDVVAVEADVQDGDYIVVEIPANFKGRIYAYAIDKVNNAPVEHEGVEAVEVHENHKKDNGYSALDSDKPEKGYRQPVGLISETAEQHATYEEHATITPSTTTDYKTEDKKDLYVGDVELDITITDTYSGIRDFTWTIHSEALGKTETATITVQNDGSYGETSASVGNKSRLVIDDKAVVGEKNLITSMKGTLTVSSEVFSSNDVVVSLQVTDRAKNTMMDAEGNIIDDATMELNIDVDDPVVTVSYKDTTKDKKAIGYFYKRVATITVEDRNFNKGAVVYNIQNEHGAKVPEMGEWGLVETYKNGISKYEATIEYTEDGDYTFKIDVTDFAGNMTEDEKVTYDGEAPQEFTIDTILPEVKVSYDNNSARNEKYFKANRTATVTITEHNFPLLYDENDDITGVDSSRVDRIITARLNGEDIDQPEITWVHDGDIHTATIKYMIDGDYTFDLDVFDLAGNEKEKVNYGDSVAATDFTIDTKIDNNGKAIIGGVANGKPYKGVVIPTVEFTDVNLEDYDLHLYRTRRAEINVDITSAANLRAMVTMDSQTGKGSFDIFKKLSNGIFDQNDDGIYRLTITMTDKAGNTSDLETVNFSINRFGSVYVYGPYLTLLLEDGGRYVKKVAEPIVITEYNPDRILEDSVNIEVTCDGKPVEVPVQEIDSNAAVGKSGWYEYKYSLAPSYFKSEGVYKISVSSKDAAGNSPENNNYEDKDILFRVDSTVPEITSIVGLEEPRYREKDHKFTYTVFDAMGIKEIVVSVNGNPVQTISREDFGDDINNYNGEFVLKEGSDQNIEIVVKDLADNETKTSDKKFKPEYVFNDEVTISTNFFVLWYDNTWLFWGSIGGFVAVVGVAIAILIVAKRKKEEELNIK